ARGAARRGRRPRAARRREGDAQDHDRGRPPAPDRGGAEGGGPLGDPRVSVAGTYAEALYEAAAEARAVKDVSGDLTAFQTALAEVPELLHVMHDPEIGGREKKAILASLTEGGHRILVNFLQVLIDRRRSAV